MKLSHVINSQKTRQAGPIWGLALGVLLTAAGIGLWCNGKLSGNGSGLDESLTVASLLVGIFTAIYAGHELRRR